MNDFLKNTYIATDNLKSESPVITFMKDLARLAGDDLVYSLALESGNIILCVTAFPSMTDKKFAASEDGMRALFLIDPDEYTDAPDVMAEKLAKAIDNEIYYEKDVADPSTYEIPEELL